MMKVLLITICCASLSAGIPQAGKSQKVAVYGSVGVLFELFICADITDTASSSSIGGEIVVDQSTASSNLDAAEAQTLKTAFDSPAVNFGGSFQPKTYEEAFENLKQSVDVNGNNCSFCYTS